VGLAAFVFGVCGICGAAGFSDGFPVDQAILARMTASLAHRGPDGSGTWVQGPVGLGHRRLSIVDLSEAGRQPMSNEDGTVWITYNGEVYNHLALRAELERKGHIFRSRTDTETLVHLYEEEGPAFVERLQGMFALAIHDQIRGELHLVRDRVGVKPLLYAQLPGGVVFGSEVRALLEHPSVTPDVDEEALYHYLTFAFAPAPMTMYRGIRKLRPAERITFRRDGSSTSEIYWSPLSPRVAEEVAAMEEPEIEERLLELLRGSISKRLMSDVPFGVFLSGGLDSTANVALMSELIDEPVRTYSTSPRGHPRHDELGHARLVAERFSTDHHEVPIDESDFDAYIPELVRVQDEPLSDWTAIPQHFVSQRARDTGTVVVQVGEGADELFHGYHGYSAHRRYVVPFQRLPASLRRRLGAFAASTTRRAGRGVRHGQLLEDAGRSSIPYWGGSICFRGQLKQELASGLHQGSDSLDFPAAYWHEAAEALPGADIFQRMSYIELKQRLPELLLMRLDRVAMASSVEGREPFLDHELVEFALALPPSMKFRNGVGKHALRRAVEGIVPREVLERRKQGFGTPMAEWMRGAFGERARTTVARSTLMERGLLDRDVADRLFVAHLAGAGDWSYHLWNLYTLAAWHDHWIADRDELAHAA
jgi:asparagine synthase (glutamine-hydrolysing)